jgi:cytochrome c oxidase assembly protein subunit 15
MSHLLGGVLIFSTLCRIGLQLSSIPTQCLPKIRTWVILALCIVFLQIALGGWVSSNYAGIACIGFPQCNGQWLPELQLSEGFNLLSPVGNNYQGGVLDSAARASIQYIHRIGAMVTASYITLLVFFLLRSAKSKTIKNLAIIILSLVVLQFTLGVLNVLYLLPLPVAVLHNGVAALLMATLLMMLYLTQGKPGNEC